ncbi:MAG: lipopolysaccharide assembly LapA domain-containing protein [Woeseiaceae bacterium]
MIRRIITVVLLIAIVLMAAVFASLNTELISVDFLFAKYALPQSVVIIGALIIGTFVGLLCASFFVLRYLAERRRLRKALRTAETEISSLRSLPLQDAH